MGEAHNVVRVVAPGYSLVWYNTDEVTADDQLLTINVEDMEDYRKKGIKEVNKMFGTSITVKRNPSYNVNSYTENKESDKNADKELSDK